MDRLSEFLIEFIASENNPIGLAIMALSAMFEYLVPPFPGDTITLFAAALITAYRWSFFPVFGAVMAGSVAGSMAAFYLGAWLARRRDGREGGDDQGVTERLVSKFRRYGAVYLVINRFLPGIRALFFVAAGMARMRARSVLLYSALSAALWNLGLIALGSALGANFDTLLAWVRRYTVAAWIVVGAVVITFMLRIVLARRRAGTEATSTEATSTED